MRQSTFDIPPKVSISLASLMGRKRNNLRPSVAAKAAGFAGADPDAIHESDRVSLLVESTDAAAVQDALQHLRNNEELDELGGDFLSALVSTDTVPSLISEQAVTRVQTKKRSSLHLDAALPEIGVLNTAGGQRLVAEDGAGVIIGIIDSGFDLSHPMFRDGQNRLRVDALLDQTGGNREYTQGQLENRWSGGKTGPGADEHGHGTHVAGIAGGSNFQSIYEGVAPGARLILVKTDLVNTDRAVSWIFKKAGNTPCVINMSLGHHFGSHDGTDAEERLHQRLTGPGKIIVVSAGNERTDNIHIGGRFFAGQSEEVAFDLVRQVSDPPFVVTTLWHHQTDGFNVELVTPSGQVVQPPKMGKTTVLQTSVLDIDYGIEQYAWSNSVQMEIKISFKTHDVRDRDLRNWKLRIRCIQANIGRLDGWFNNSGFAIFKDHPMVERNRTVGLTATGDGCIAVASHVSRTTWNGDLGSSTDSEAVVGRTSSFSSLGPTRDGKWKPEISAPGQYITSALADSSMLAGIDERALTNQRLLTIEGTSMAAPIITGIVALLLQKNNGLDVAQVREVLRDTAKHDLHTGPAAWDPAYGFGKVDVAAALARI